MERNPEPAPGKCGGESEEQEKCVDVFLLML